MLKEMINSYDEALNRYSEAVREWQKSYFPDNPVLLLQLKVFIKGSDNPIYFYAIPKDMKNPNNSEELIYFDVIEQDKIVERSFVGCSIIVSKIVYGNVWALLAAPNAPVVFDDEYRAYRPSKVILTLK